MLKLGIIYLQQVNIIFDYINYKIKENEIILLEEILFDSYFDDIILQTDNKYIKSFNTYNIAQPKIKLNYSSKVEYDLNRRRW